MYIPNFNREDDSEKLVGFMQSYNFATLVSILEGVPIASHIPVVTKFDGETVTLRGHLARANPHCGVLENTEMLAIFTGPHAYISPKNYKKLESVPTWNYVAVHAYGQPKTLTFKEKPEEMQTLVAELISVHEASYEEQWNSLSEKYQHGMMRGIVGFEMKVSRLEGKYKLSQNRSEVEQKAVARALRQNTDPTVSDVGVLMEEELEGKH